MTPARAGSLALVALAAACTPAAIKPFLLDSDIARLKEDTKASCMVAATLYAGGMGDLGIVRLATTGGDLETTGVTGGALSALTDGFAFVNVPKGPFRVTYMKYERVTGKTKFGNAEVEKFEFNFKGQRKNFIGGWGIGAVPDEMSGTCNGGFIYLGVFKADRGGLFSEPSFKASSDSMAAEGSKNSMKQKLGQSPWAAEIDHPAENTPLPADQAVGVQLDPAAQKAAGEAAVARVMGQTREVTAPPSDPGAHAAAAGSWVLDNVSGKPVPYTFPNKCTLIDAGIVFKADGSYSTTANMECNGNKLPLIATEGLFGITGEKVTFAVSKGPPAAGESKLAGGVFSTTLGGDTYNYKKK